MIGPLCISAMIHPIVEPITVVSISPFSASVSGDTAVFITGLGFLNEKIWDKSHPEHSDFLIELNRIKSLTHVYHNMHDLLNEEKTIL